MSKKKRTKKYALVRSRYKDGILLYSDVLREFKTKTEARTVLQNFEAEYRNAIIGKNTLYEDIFSIKSV